MTSLAGCNEDPGGLGDDPQPRYNHTPLINNNVDKSRMVKVEITHVDTNDHVYRTTHTVKGDAELNVVNFEELKDSYSGRGLRNLR